MDSRRPIRSLDALRIASALAIMGVHFAGHLSTQLSLPLGPLDRINVVDLFFVLSGFLLFHIYADKMETAGDHWRFLRQRFARLYPLHALTCLIFIGVGYLCVALGRTPRVASSFEATSALSHLLLMQAWNTLPEVGLNGPSWSLSAEFFLMLAFPALVRLLRRNGSLATTVVAIGTAVLFAAARDRLGLRPWSEATFDFGIFRALPFFMMGMIVADVCDRHPSWTMSWGPTSALGVGIVALLICGAPQSLSLLTFPMFLALLVLSDRRHSPAWLADERVGALANLTFGIFLLHTIFAIALVVTVRTLGLHAIPMIAAVAVLFACATIGAAAIVYRYVETPMRRQLAPRSRRTDKAPAAARSVFPLHDTV